MRRSHLLLIILFSAMMLLAKPSWEVTVYPTSTVAYGNVTIEGTPADEGDIVYGFVHRECRGMQPVKIANGKAYMTMNIQGLEDHEPVYFKLWDESENIVYDVDFTTYTNPNHDIGYPPDVLPVNAVKDPVLYFFPPEELVMHPYEVRNLNVGFYCNTIEVIKDIRFFGDENLSVEIEGLTLIISAITSWTGEEELEIELLNDKKEVLNYGTVLIIVE